jgi:methylated-DNA-protein-cysteine methyltransferase-like protein
VREIPRGRVSSYGTVGRCLKNPASGFMVGRWMASCPPDVPWWRVVNKQGRLPIGKRAPELALEQRRLLEREGVKFDGDTIRTKYFWERD